MKNRRPFIFDWANSFDCESVRGVDDSKNMPTGLPTSEKTSKHKSDNTDDESYYRDIQNQVTRLEHETHLHIEHSQAVSRISFVDSSRVWEGRVLSVKETTFTARLEDRTGAFKPRIVEMEKKLINRRDWDQFFKEGFPFEWVFQKVNMNGTIKNRKEIRFSPTPQYLPDEIDTLVKSEMDAFAYLFDDD